MHLKRLNHTQKIQKLKLKFLKNLIIPRHNNLWDVKQLKCYGEQTHGWIVVNSIKVLLVLQFLVIILVWG